MEPVSDARVAERFAAEPRMLAIVNTRAHAQKIFTLIRELPGAAHLSTLRCPRHRRTKLAALRARLKAGDPVRLVSTSLIEAGVDISFDEVWRAATGLESVAHGAERYKPAFRVAGLRSAGVIPSPLSSQLRLLVREPRANVKILKQFALGLSEQEPRTAAAG